MKAKDRILKAALVLFNTKGFIGTHIVDIAAEADVAVGTVYYHFKDKERLALHTVDMAYDFKDIFEALQRFQERREADGIIPERKKEVGHATPPRFRFGGV